MAENNEPVIRVTLEDLAAVRESSVAAAAPAMAPAPAGTSTYGNINTAIAETEPPVPEQKASLLLQGWFYLGAAGLLGAVAGWGICEPAFTDEGGEMWGNIWLLPLVTMLTLVCFALAESVVERSIKKALTRLAMVIPLGVVFGFIFSGVANIVYSVGLEVIFSAGVETHRNPAWWIARALGWATFGVAGGLIYGLVGQSSRKAKYGVLGGAIGAAIGGFAFDPISLLVDHAMLSRAVGLGLLGMATGAAMGFVENALKDRWIYVTAGPLAGKQFILYKASTTIGSSQGCDIYLFKDNNIAPQHAVIDVRGTQATLRASAPVMVSGVPSVNRVLLGGDIIQIGRYVFRYNERHR